jgi:DNA-binding IclR family transcriptional regulator
MTGPGGGGRCPAFCVAAGRALLAHQPAVEIARVLSSPLPRFTDATLTHPQDLDDLLATVRTEGFASNRGCFRDGVGGIALPVRDHTGSAIASVGICLPEHRFGPDRLPILREAIFEAAQAISSQLGFSDRLVGYLDQASRIPPTRTGAKRIRKLMS